MPIKVEVKKNETSETITIDVLDNLICQDFDWPVNEEIAIGYDLLANLAIAIMMQFGGGHVTKQTFDKYKNVANDKSLIHNADETKLRKWLYEDYTWNAWR